MQKFFFFVRDHCICQICLYSHLLGTFLLPWTQELDSSDRPKAKKLRNLYPIWVESVLTFVTMPIFFALKFCRQE